MSEYVTTPNLALKKPNYDQGDGQWGYWLNDNSDVLDALLTQDGTAKFLPIAGGAMKGTLLLHADPAQALEAATKGYADRMLPLAGGTMTGPLIFSPNPAYIQTTNGPLILAPGNNSSTYAQGIMQTNQMQVLNGGAGLVWSGTTTPYGYYMNGNFSGSTTNTGVLYLNPFAIPSDAIQAPATGGGVFGFGFIHNAAAGYTGGRAGMQVLLTQTGQSGNKAAGLAQSVIAGAYLGATAQTSEGGTAADLANSYGQVFGANLVATLVGGAINYNQLTGLEINVNAEAGSSVYQKTLLALIDGADPVKGTANNDTFIRLGQQQAAGGATAAATWDIGIGFGDPLGAWPFDPGAALLRAQEPQNPLASLTRQAVAGFGVDWGFCEFGSAAWRSIGASINGSGVATLQGLNLTNWAFTLPPSGDLAIGSTQQKATAIAIAAGGNGWAVGDKFSFGAAGVGKVTAVSSGVATAVTMLVPAVNSSPPANPVATAATNNSAGHTGGSGLTLNVTWSTAGARLDLQTGITFGGVLASGYNDFSKHIELYGGFGGISVTSGMVNIVSGSAIGEFAGNVQIGTWWSDGLHLAKGFAAWGSATPPASKPTVTGSKGGNAALTSLLTALAAYGLVTDSTT